MGNNNFQLRYIEERFGDGECAVFARALSSLTGYPIVLLRMAGSEWAPSMPKGFPRHAVVETPGGNFLDAFGSVSLEAIEDRLEARLVVDRGPNMERYPFADISDEDMNEATELALEMLEMRKLETTARGGAAPSSLRL